MQGCIIVRFDPTEPVNQEAGQASGTVVLEGIVSLVPEGFLTKICGSPVRLTIEDLTPAISQ